MGAPEQQVDETARQSPVAAVPRSKLPRLTEVMLAARAAGRCEFRGCNELLYRHPLTGEVGNFAENAHVVAFRKEGARGDETRPVNINDIDNLMLLCRRDHKLVDDNPDRYSREELEQQKREHEARIKRVTGLGPSMQTTVFELTAKIGQFKPVIGRAEIADALLPRYPSDGLHKLDLTGLGNEEPGPVYELAYRRIRQEVDRLHASGGDLETTRHLSVFAIAPMPMLVALGYELGNKLATDFFQCHRTRKQNRWNWYEAEAPARFQVRKLKSGTTPACVGLVLSLSGPFDARTLPAVIDERYALYEIAPIDAVPNTSLLRQREDLEAFRAVYRTLLAELRRDHDGLPEIHFFPALPAPAAVTCGFDLLPKVDPTLIIYDNVTAEGGFIKRLEVNTHER